MLLFKSLDSGSNLKKCLSHRWDCRRPAPPGEKSIACFYLSPFKNPQSDSDNFIDQVLCVSITHLFYGHSFLNYIFTFCYLHCHIILPQMCGTQCDVPKHAHIV